MTDFKALGARLSNWRRWGAHDERGTLNFVTPDRIQRAASLVRHGQVFSLAVPMEAGGMGTDGPRANPVHLMSQTAKPMGNGAAYSDDYLATPLQAATQWDALSHYFYDGALYNGFDAATITAAGAVHLDVRQLNPGVVGRGVLLDIPAVRGVRWLEAGQAIGPADLEAAQKAQGVRVEPGDVLCVRTGWRRRFIEAGSAGWFAGEPGLDLDCAQWLSDHEVAAVAADNWGVEVLPSPDPSTFAPLHCVLIRDLGMPLGEIFDLEALAESCHADQAWDFLFLGAPLPVTGAVGSPVNPLAMK